RHDGGLRPFSSRTAAWATRKEKGDSPHCGDRDDEPHVEADEAGQHEDRERCEDPAEGDAIDEALDRVEGRGEAAQERHTGRAEARKDGGAGEGGEEHWRDSLQAGAPV